MWSQLSHGMKVRLLISPHRSLYTQILSLGWLRAGGEGSGVREENANQPGHDDGTGYTSAQVGQEEVQGDALAQSRPDPEADPEISGVYTAPCG